jgi:hypothetical protein
VPLIKLNSKTPISMRLNILKLPDVDLSAQYGGHRLHVEVQGSVARANEKAAELSRRAWLLLWRRNGPRPSA